VPSRPGLDLAGAASNGGGGGLTAARSGQEGGAPFMGGQGACKRPQGTTATSMGAHAGLGRSEWQGGLERTDGPPGVPGRTARDARRKGQDFEAASVGAWPGEGRLRDATGWARTSRQGRRGAGARARRAASKTLHSATVQT
jgi:hypothetical protein